mmetsp:Transcript_31445/g.86479  ORF Transcript_31445/g.86479 Transcript_31445/m.86479 type:complete len:254 (-) Transcript_31445:908-1669(-)
MPIDPHCPCIQLIGESVGFLHISAPNGSPQSERCPVGTPQGFGVILVRHHGHHGPKLLLVHQACTLSDADDNGRQIKQSCVRPLVARWAGGSSAAAEDTGATLTSVFDKLFDMPQLNIVRQGSELYTVKEAVAKARAASTFDERIHELIKDVLLNVEPLYCATRLPVVEERGLENAISSGGDIAIGSNDCCVIPSELEQDTLKVLRASGHDLAPDRGRSCEHDLSHQWMPCEELPWQHARAVLSDDHIQNPRR